METTLNPDVAGLLRAHLGELCLPTIRGCFTEVAQQAIQETLSYERFLLELVEREVEVRAQHRIERRLRESRLPLEKSLEAFDLGRLPAKLKQQFAALLEGSFLERRENVLAFGNPGSGKTHLLCALCQELVQKDHRVLYVTCSLLVQELLIAKRDLKLASVLKRLGRYEALMIDDLGYVQQSREEMEVLFTLLADRCERGSVLITSNLPFSQWEVIFKDPMTTAAAIDRLVHHSVILEVNLPSYRVAAAKQGRAVPGKGARSEEPETSHEKDAASPTNRPGGET
jgi:DNA replication protein DnaC